MMRFMRQPIRELAPFTIFIVVTFTWLNGDVALVWIPACIVSWLIWQADRTRIPEWIRSLIAYYVLAFAAVYLLWN